jgi:hypothetical protein
MRNNRIRSGAGLLALVVAVFAACAQYGAQEGTDGGSETRVDCLVPGQIRQLDEKTTVTTQRQLVRTTRKECLSRGGEELPQNVKE